MTIPLDEPIRLLPLFRERVWGRKTLEPYFPQQDFEAPVGEVWFTSDENQTSAGLTLGELIRQEPRLLGSSTEVKADCHCPLLAKLLFTTERLSVQVHPDDDYAREHHGGLGKTEAWYVIAAEAQAEVALGFREPVSPETLRSSAETGAIKDLIDWRRVEAGDALFVPAGTVHAIGAGLTICEIQENSDITYRLHDYGRPRELHVADGAAVADLRPYRQTPHRKKLASWREQLIECGYFRIEKLSPMNSLLIERGLEHYILLICLNGRGSIGKESFAAGQCWLVPAGNAVTQITGSGCEWLLAYTADQPLALMHAE